jgi:hypothetical protein
MELTFEKVIGWFVNTVHNDLEGYELVCIRELPKQEGEHYSYVVLSRYARNEPGFKVNTYATHIGVLNGMLPQLVHGHYDMSQSDAIVDFNKRR